MPSIITHIHTSGTTIVRLGTRFCYTITTTFRVESKCAHMNACMNMFLDTPEIHTDIHMEACKISISQWHEPATSYCLDITSSYMLNIQANSRGTYKYACLELLDMRAHCVWTYSVLISLGFAGYSDYRIITLFSVRHGNWAVHSQIHIQNLSNRVSSTITHKIYILVVEHTGCG